MRPPAPVLAVAAVAAAAVLIEVGSGRLVEREPADDPGIAEAVANGGEEAGRKSIPVVGNTDNRMPVRPVAPGIVAVPPIETATLLRVEPRRPLSPIGQAPDPADGPPEETILYRPVATAAGHIAAQGYEIEFAGIVVTPADETCGTASSSWPCGIHARTAFRNLLRGRAVACVVPPVPSEETLIVDCRLGELDPAAWLVEQGWAHAEPGGAYAGLEAAARAARRGLFRDASASPFASGD